MAKTIPIAPAEEGIGLKAGPAGVPACGIPQPDARGAEPMICPTCKGAQHIEGVATTVDANSRKTSAPVSVMCLTCRGTGYITAEEAKRIAENRGRLKERK